MRKSNAHVARAALPDSRFARSGMTAQRIANQHSRSGAMRMRPDALAPGLHEVKIVARSDGLALDQLRLQPAATVAAH
jgi:hypothetical protein